jgi:GT2 family glycosyltransferase
MDPASLTIIIPTRDRKDSLREAVLSLASLDYPRDRYEVLVVDDGSVDGTGEMIREIRSRYPVSLDYYRQDRKGLSAAKNLGIRMAQGEYLVFTDEDCVFEKDWLHRLMAGFDSPDVGVVGGPDRIPPRSPFLARCSDYCLTSFVGTGGVREGEKMRVAYYYPRGCNCAIPRSVFDRVEGFDESLIPGEDIEVVYRIRQAGYAIRFVPGAFVWHKRRGSLTGFSRQIFYRGHGRAELGRRHRDLLEFSYLLPSIMVIGFIVLLVLSFWVPLALKGFLFASGLYLAVLGIGGIHGALRMKDFRGIGIIPCLLLLQHVAYGLGFLLALRIPRKGHAA